MPKRSSKDVNQIAASIVAKLSGEPLPEDEPKATKPKNAAAVELGRLGGLKGGKARAESMSAKRRAEIASKAAQDRWAKSTKRKPNPPF